MLKPLRRSRLSALLLVILPHACCATGLATQDPSLQLEAASHPLTGETFFLLEKTPYLQVRLSQTKGSTVSVSENGIALYDNGELQTSITQSTPALFRIGQAESNSAAPQSSLQIQLGEAFASGKLTLRREDGSVTELDSAMRSGRYQAISLELVDRENRSTLISASAPIEVTTNPDLSLSLLVDPSNRLSLHLPLTVDYVPGAEYADSPADFNRWYPVTADSPPPDNIWSLASWLDAPAGNKGRIRRAGDALFYGDKPMKLWGINNTYAAAAPPRETADKRAALYAALGINSVRLHKYADGPRWAGIQSDTSFEEFDPDMLDRMDYFVAALKERGIFVKLSPVFITKLGPADLDSVPYMAEFGPIPTEPGKRLNPKHGSLYLSTEIQDLLIRQVTKLLQHRNPYTGERYADDPAIAFVEIFNEDSALFYGTSRQIEKSPTLRQRAIERFREWLLQRYGTPKSLQDAWGATALNPNFLPESLRDESWLEFRLHPYGHPWIFDPVSLNGENKPHRQRILDTMAFLYDLQNEVYDRYAKAIRETGYEGELIASNWRAGRSYSHYLNLHSDSRFGTIDRHNYFGGESKDPFNFKSASMLAQPGSGLLSTGLQQVQHHPFMLSEWIHVYPSEWGAEGPALIGAYGMGLQGWDASYAFQNGDEGQFSQRIGSHPWDATAPQFAMMLPAVSRQVLRQDILESSATQLLKVNSDALQRGELGFQDEALMAWDVKTFDTDVIPSETLAVSRIAVAFTETQRPTPEFDLSPYRHQGALHAVTGQLSWTPGKRPQDGHVIIDTPATQALLGFANGTPARLPFADIETRSRFAAVYLTALDKESDLAHDESILVTAIGRTRNKGSVYAHDSFLYRSGDGPALLEPIQVTLRLKRSGSPTVEAVSQLGVPTGTFLEIGPEGRVEIDTGVHHSPYYLIRYRN